MSALRDLWEDKGIYEDNRSTFQYVMELRDKLSKCAKIAAQNAKVSFVRYKSFSTFKSHDRQFKPDEVLLLLPDSSRKLLLA